MTRVWSQVFLIWNDRLFSLYHNALSLHEDELLDLFCPLEPLQNPLSSWRLPDKPTSTISPSSDSWWLCSWLSLAPSLLWVSFVFTPRLFLEEATWGQTGKSCHPFMRFVLSTRLPTKWVLSTYWTNLVKTVEEKADGYPLLKKW